MSMPIILAHGALGWADELIFVGVAVVFLMLMGVQWVKSRADEENMIEQDDLLSADHMRTDENDTDRFRLD